MQVTDIEKAGQKPAGIYNREKFKIMCEIRK